MFIGGGENGFTARVLMLYVAKGNAFLTIGVGGFVDEAVALEKAKAVACDHLRLSIVVRVLYAERL